MIFFMTQPTVTNLINEFNMDNIISDLKDGNFNARLLYALKAEKEWVYLYHTLIETDFGGPPIDVYAPYKFDLFNPVYLVKTENSKITNIPE